MSGLTPEERELCPLTRRPLGDPTASVWHEAARQLLTALDADPPPSGGDGEVGA